MTPGDTETTVPQAVAIAFRYVTFKPLFSAPTAFPPAVPANGSIDFDVRIRCDPNTPVGDHGIMFQILSADGSTVLDTPEFIVTVTFGPPSKHVPVDPSIVWEETTGLSISAAENAWHIGHINDMPKQPRAFGELHRLKHALYYAGSDTGGQH